MFMQSEAPIDLLLHDRIQAAEAEISRQRATIAILEAQGHEVTDAKKHLGCLLESFAGAKRFQEENLRVTLGNDA